MFSSSNVGHIILIICLYSIHNSHSQGLNKKIKEPQTSQSLEDKVKALTDLSLKRSAVLRFNGDKFRQYVRSAPRNYSIVLLLTALSPQRQCAICRQAHDEFDIVASSYRYEHFYSKKIFFAEVDFDEGSDVFSSLGLNSAPVIMHFPAKGKQKKTDTMDISRLGFHAEAIGRWVQERTDVQIRILRPPNYAGPLAILLLAMLIGGLLYMRRNNLDFLYNRTSWGIAALCVILAFLSGQMWNQIRGPPFMHRNPQTGATGFIHSSSQFQFTVETYIVFLLYAAVSAGFIVMLEAAEGKGDPGRRRIMACAGLATVVIFFSLLLSVFRSKYSGYPYSFLFK